MLDLTSALYLDERHPSSELDGWSSLTSGRPAALRASAAGEQVAARLAARVGCAAALLTRSTLHAIADCLAVLAGPGTTVIADRWLYPVGEWAVQGHAGRGGRTVQVRHHDPTALRDALSRSGRHTVVLADGWCSGCGRGLPLRAHLRAVEDAGAVLVLDDTQALGVLGSGRTPADPLGRGGGGTAAWCGVRSPALVLVSSAAKALGVPTALTAGSQQMVRRLREQAPSRVHSSPPSAADEQALRSAVLRDDRDGDVRRRRLAWLVARLRDRAARAGIALRGGLFPVQSLPDMPVRTAGAVHRRLLADGVRTVPQAARCRPGATVTLLVTTALMPDDVDEAVDALARAWHAEVRRAC